MVVTELEKYPIFARIDGLRLYALKQPGREFRRQLEADIVSFDTELKLELKRRGHDEKLRKFVPEWHKLVGSTPELHPLDDSVRGFIVAEVERLVLQIETLWGLAA